MVAAEGDEAGFAVARASPIGWRGGVRTQLKKRFGHLSQSESVVERRDRDIAAVEDFEARVVWVDASSSIEGSVWELAG